MSRFDNRRSSSASLYVYAVFSGVVLTFAFPRHDFFFLAWIALVPFLWGLTDCNERAALKAGMLFGLAFFFGTQYWIYHSITHYGNVHVSLSIIIVVLLCLYESLYPAMFGVLVSHVSNRTRFPLVMVAPALWVCLEYARGLLFTGFPWSFLGHSQYKLVPLIQIADITGTYGISFLVVAVNSAIVDFLIVHRKKKTIPLYPAVPSYLGAFLVALALVVSLGYGFYRLQERPSEHTLTAAIIQGNIDQNMKWDTKYQNAVFSSYLTLTHQALEQKPDLVVWPETAVPFFFGTDQDYTDRLTAFQKESKVPLLFGSVLIKSITEGKYRLTNSAVLLDGDGKVLYSYDKIHLVPFGEYVPLRNILFFVDKLVEGVGDYIPGREPKIAKTPIGQFAPAICYELVFPSLLRKFFARGGEFLITITNDAWFGKTSGPYQHFYAAVFRAIENRKPVIRAANSGISGFIDAYGRITEKSDLFKRQVLVATIEKNRTVTFYTKYGDLFIYFCLLTVAVLIINLIFHTKSHFGGKRW